MATAAELYGDYLAAADETDANRALGQLFSGWLMVWCKETVGRNLGCYGLRDADRTDLAAEIVAEILLAIMLRLRMSRLGTAEPVNNIRAYLAATAQNACFGRIRTRCPHHVQLQNRIRYLLRNDPRFAAWTNSAGEPLAGRGAWTSQEQHVPCPDLQRTNDPLDLVLDGLITLANGPLRVTDVVRTIAAALGISDSAGPVIDPDSLPSRERGSDQRLVERERLTGLWREVRELSLSQRVALLLNLRDPEGGGVIELLPVTGVASHAEIAQLLGMTETALAEMWHDLPLEDSRIADLLRLSRQQVINLRKSARDRLGRRMQKMEGNTRAPLTSTGNRGLSASVDRLTETVFGRKGMK